MRKLMLTAAALVALTTASAGWSAESPPAEQPNPAQLCKQQRTAMGEAAFKALYGTNANKSNAFGKCVSKQAKAVEDAQDEAAQKCRAEQNDPNFAASHGGKTFEQFYGTNKNGKNAFGKCVSQQTKTEAAEQQQATLNAAKACKAERAANPTAFRNKYGTNKNKSNAFGKCVSQKAKQQ